MTLPDERYRAIKAAREFLRDLLDPSKTKRVPKAVRQRAYAVLKHFPGEYDTYQLARKAPDILNGAEDE